jgi:hypothetical protein
MVVFSEVKRRKRTAMGGIGALGRKARYSSRKIGTKSTATKMEVSIQGSEIRDRGSGATPIKRCGMAC